MSVHDTERTPENVIDAPGREGDSHGFGFRAKHYENAVVFFFTFYNKVLSPVFSYTNVWCFALGQTSFSMLTIKSHTMIAKYDENDERSPVNL